MSKILPYTLMLAGAAYISLFGVPGLSGKASQESKPSTPVAGEASQSLQDLEQILGPWNAYAGDFPNPFEGDPRFDFFDRGVYKDDSSFPESRWDYQTFLSDEDGDLAQIFEKDHPLYQPLGRHLEPLYRFGSIGNVCFNPQKTELGIGLEINGEWYGGFTSVDQKTVDLLEKYNIE